MTIDKVVKYVTYTPYNTNKNILIPMLQQLILDHGGSLDGDTPDVPEDVIYDGGIEK